MKLLRFILGKIPFGKLTIGCLLGIHAWKNGVCVNCGKRR